MPKLFKKVKKAPERSKWISGEWAPKRTPKRRIAKAPAPRRTEPKDTVGDGSTDSSDKV